MINGQRSVLVGALICVGLIGAMTACTSAAPERRKILERTYIGMNDELKGKVRFEYGSFSNTCKPAAAERIEQELMKDITGDENGYEAAADWFLNLCREDAKNDPLMSPWAWGVTASRTYEDARMVSVKIDETMLMNDGHPSRTVRYLLFDVRTGARRSFFDVFDKRYHTKVERIVDAAFRRELSSRAAFRALAWDDMRVNYENFGIDGREYVFFCTMSELFRHSPETLAGMRDIARLVQKPVLVRIPLEALRAERMLERK
mgnify:FL=1